MPAKFEIVPRPKDGGGNAPGAAQASLRRERHQDELKGDLGLKTSVRRLKVDTSIDRGTIVLAIGAAILTFLLIVLLMLWRDGKLPRLWPEKGFDFPARAPTSEWTMGGERAVVIVRPRGPAAAPAADGDGPVDAKAEYDVAHPRPPAADDEDEAGNAQ